MNPFHPYSKRLFRLAPQALVAAGMLLLPACKKMVTINEPINTITSAKVFSTDAQANAAMAGVFTQMINGKTTSNSPTTGFSTGLSTLLGALSSDELNYYSSAYNNYYAYNISRLQVGDAPSATLWTTAYSVIYGCNAVIEGVAASTASTLHDSVRNVLTGEARFIRAFSYFYLTNFFGDVPLVVTTDYNQTAGMVKTSKAEVYRQMVADLKAAQLLLPTNYATAGGERFRPNKYAATALLARVYLYTGDDANAALQAADVISRTEWYGLETLNNVFLKNSREAIWQLQQNTSNSMGTGVPEGMTFISNPLNTGLAPYFLTTSLQNAFETDDQRKVAWVKSTDYNLTGVTARYYFPFKYKTGRYNYSVGGIATEYYMVFRLAEQYLIHAEALANGGGTGVAEAIKDLNKIRLRAGLGELPLTLSKEATLIAVAKERQTELFAEWGHRWLDLKRTGKAHDVLSVLPLKQPWAGDYQLLYPIPLSEIQANVRLVQNADYK